MDVLAGLLADDELGRVCRELPEGGGGHDVVRVDEALLRLGWRLLGLHDGLLELGATPDPDVAREVRDEAGPDHGAVVVDDVGVGDDVGQVAVRCGEQGESWAEQEEGHVVGRIEADDFRQDGEGRVVHDDAVLRVLVVHEVTAREEGPHHFLPFQGPQRVHEGEDGVVHLSGGVAVVRGLLRLELAHEAVVVLEDLLLGSALGGLLDLRLADDFVEKAQLLHFSVFFGFLCLTTLSCSLWYSRSYLSQIS